MTDQFDRLTRCNRCPLAIEREPNETKSTPSRVIHDASRSAAHAFQRVNRTDNRIHGNNAIWATTGKGFDEIRRRTWQAR